MSASAAPRLAPVDIVIVEDQVPMAEQLAELLTLWGAASATVAASFAEAVERFTHHPMPRLILLDHLLLDGTGCEIALWLLARPSLRERSLVISYTNSDRTVVQQNLRDLLAQLQQDEALAMQLLGATDSPERVAIEPLLHRAISNHEELGFLFDRLYDVYLSKHVSMREVRAALAPLTQLSKVKEL